MPPNTPHELSDDEWRLVRIFRCLSSVGQSEILRKRAEELLAKHPIDSPSRYSENPQQEVEEELNNELDFRLRCVMPNDDISSLRDYDWHIEEEGWPDGIAEVILGSSGDDDNAAEALVSAYLQGAIQFDVPLAADFREDASREEAEKDMREDLHKEALLFIRAWREQVVSRIETSTKVTPISGGWSRHKATPQGDAQAQYGLALLYHYGHVMPQDYVQAHLWLSLAAAQGHEMATQERDKIVIEMTFAQVAEAQRLACEWFEKAAAQGNAIGQAYIGSLYRDGLGVAQDYVTARQWYEKAAEQGQASAQYSLGDLYRAGQGGPQDYAKARQWWEKAAAQGIEKAQFFLGVLYRLGLGVPQDYAMARQWYEKAAAQGDMEAQYFLGDLYRDGQGVQQDYVQAREWYEQAASCGHATAQTSLGALCSNGEGGPQDDALARKWYEQAAVQGDVTAQTNLGVLYSNGDGGPQDYAKAREWFEKAATQSDATAQFFLGLLHAYGRGIQQDYAVARQWYEKAAEQGQDNAQSFLGDLYHHGLGVPQDYVQAHLWLSLAVVNGNEMAPQKLDEIVSKMTPSQVAEAQRLAQEWQPKRMVNP